MFLGFDLGGSGGVWEGVRRRSLSVSEVSVDFVEEERVRWESRDEGMEEGERKDVLLRSVELLKASVLGGMTQAQRQGQAFEVLVLTSTELYSYLLLLHVLEEVNTKVVYIFEKAYTAQIVSSSSIGPRANKPNARTLYRWSSQNDCFILHKCGVVFHTYKETSPKQ